MSRWETETFNYSKPHVRLLKCAEEAARDSPKSVFELGCGLGLLREELLRRLPDLDYFGCDVSHAAVAQLDNPQIVQTDLRADPLPFSGVTFDCIVGSGVFEYIEDLGGLFAELHSRLNPNGRLVASYYNMRHAYRRVLHALGKKPHRHPDWRNDLSPGEFRMLLERAGFRIEKVLPVNVCLTWMRGPKESQRALVSHLQARMPLKELFGHQLIYVGRKRE